MPPEEQKQTSFLQSRTGLGLLGGGIGGVLGIAGGAVQAARSRKQASRMRRRARRQTAADVEQILGSRAYQTATSFLESLYSPSGTGREGTADILQAEFGRGIRQAQAARGLFFGEAGATQEASGLAAFRANLAAQFFPQLLNIAQLPVQIRQQSYAANLAAQQAGFAGAGDILSSALLAGTAGFGGGFAAGVSAE